LAGADVLAHLAASDRQHDGGEEPVGVAFAKRSGMVREGTPDEFEALAGRISVFRFESA